MNGRLIYPMLLLAMSNALFGADIDEGIVLDTARELFQNPVDQQQRILIASISKHPQLFPVYVEHNLVVLQIGSVVHKVGKGIDAMYLSKYNVLDNNYNAKKERELIMHGGAKRVPLIADQAKPFPAGTHFF